MITTAKLAARLGLSPRQVRHLAAQGRIKGAQKLGRDWVFDAKFGDSRQVMRKKS